MLLKRVDVSIDKSTWHASSPVPARFKRRLGAQDLDVDAALLFIAICTRPPVLQGFSLADTWAWLRYRSAIASRSELRLRSEWTALGRHQKTVSSDEPGVGFTTSFLAHALRGLLFADTDYVINSLLPAGRAWLRRVARTGPGKSPDYIGFDSNLDLAILECKGSQNTQAKLMSAMQHGIAQKDNLNSTWPIALSVVGGLFVPQWDSSESAILHFIDPPWSGIRRLLMRQPIELVRGAALQIAYAKVFGLIGRPALARECALTPITALRRLHTRAVFRERDARGETSIRAEHVGSFAPDRDEQEQRFVRVRAVFDLSGTAIDRWYESTDLAEMLVGEAANLRGSSWHIVTSDNATSVRSPLGFSLALEAVEVR